MRPNKFGVFMQVAETIAQLGTCDRKQVGAVIVLDGRCITWGFNGAPPGQPHCEANFHGHELDARATMRKLHPDLDYYDEYPMEQFIDVVEDRLLHYGCRNATHAEANALAFAARHGISTEGATLFVTVSPCENCARLIIASGIQEVIWKETYRDRAGIELIGAAGLRGGIWPTEV